MEYHLQRVEGMNIFRQPITYFLLLLGKGSKPTIPENKQICIVLIDIFRVGTVVYTVMGWRIKNILKPAWHFSDRDFYLYPGA